MKFYRDKKNTYYWHKIYSNNLTAIYSRDFIMFFKNGIKHNTKNAVYISDYKYIYKEFYLNDKCYGYNDDFTKKSWRKFVKLKAFL